jgi:hypothetical protein
VCQILSQPLCARFHNDPTGKGYLLGERYFVERLLKRHRSFSSVTQDRNECRLLTYPNLLRERSV